MNMYRLHKLNRFALSVLFFVFCVLIPAQLFGTASEIPVKQFLTTGWKLARIPDVPGAVGGEISRSAYDDSAWIPAVVPGTVLTIYEKAGRIGDPYYGRNLENLSQAYYNVDYWYRGRFAVPAGYAGRTVWLNFDGINWKADVFVNGSFVGKINGAFTRGRFDITRLVTCGTTSTLAVRITWTDSQYDDCPTFLCSAGWDWMPPIPGRNMGLYEDVFLSASGPVTIEDPFIVTDLPLPDVSRADLTIKASLVNHTTGMVSGVLSGLITPEGIATTRNITLAASQTLAVVLDKSILPQLSIANPKLWWPNGYGEQNLHALQLSFESAGAVSDRQEVSFGIREFSYDSAGHDLQLSVNSRRVLCKGGNWGMPDAMLKWDDATYDTAIRLHKEMNFTMIRAWHGTSDFKAFYDACDKYGILVFDDFWLNGIFPPRDTVMFMANARDKLKRLRNRACVAVWCGENEAIPPAPLNTQIPQACAQLDGTRLYIASSNSGPIHGGGPYAIQDPAWYFDFAQGFTTEIGSPCVPSVESMRAMMPASEVWPIGAGWQWHDYDGDIGNKQPERYTAALNARYGTATGIEDFCRKAQLLNLETYKAIFEAWNAKLWNDTSGVLLWMSQSAWPSTIWQTYDYYFEPTGAYFGCKKACEPLHIQWQAGEGKVRVINNTLVDRANLTAEVEVWNPDGALKYQTAKTGIAAPADSVVDCLTLFNDKTGNSAFRKSVTASSQENASLAPANAVDGDFTTRWSSSYSDPQWLAVDLGTTQSVDSAAIYWEAAYGKAYRLQVSTDGANWSDVWSTTAGNGGADVIRFAPVVARHVRLYGTSRGTWYGYSVYEFVVGKAGTFNDGIAGLSSTHFIKLRLKDTGGRILSDNFYWRGTPYLDYAALASMPRATVRAAALSLTDGETSRLTIGLTNSSSPVAFALRLKLLRKASGTRLLPAVYEDNYFSLLPGESRNVRIEFANKDGKGEAPKLMLEGWNLSTFEIPVVSGPTRAGHWENLN